MAAKVVFKLEFAAAQKVESGSLKELRIES